MDRRNFLKGLGLTVVGVAVSPKLVLGGGAAVCVIENIECLRNMQIESLRSQLLTGNEYQWRGIARVDAVNHAMYWVFLSKERHMIPEHIEAMERQVAISFQLKKDVAIKRFEYP